MDFSLKTYFTGYYHTINGGWMQVLVVFYSRYGNTALMADAIAFGTPT